MVPSLNGADDEKVRVVLSELIAELLAHTGVEAPSELGLLAAEMPLSHRCAPDHGHELLASLDHDTTLAPGIGSAARSELGLAGSVYQWLGPCAYPETDLVLVWDSSQDRVMPGVASPWDTGGLCGTMATLGRQVSIMEARALVARYTLDLAEARTYLAHVLACSYLHPTDYLAGTPPARWYPGWTPGRQPLEAALPTRTFEVRRAGVVPVFDSLVAAVVHERGFAKFPRLLRRLRACLKTKEAEYVPCRTQERAEQAARRFVWQHLEARGAL